MSDFLTPLKIYHIDDDPFCLKLAAKLISGMEGVIYCGGSDNPLEGVNAVIELNPDILLLDIELTEHDGFWVADKLRKTGTHIVFLTNHPTHALKAFEFSALHYLQKPLTKEAISEVLMRFRKLRPQIMEHQSDQLENMIREVASRISYPKRIFVNTNTEILILNLSDIVYVAANGSYTEFHLLNKKTIVSGKNLKTYSDILTKNPDLVKIHRSYIINISQLSHIDKKKLKITFCFLDGRSISVATFRKEDWMDRFCS